MPENETEVAKAEASQDTQIKHHDASAHKRIDELEHRLTWFKILSTIMTVLVVVLAAYIIFPLSAGGAPQTKISQNQPPVLQASQPGQRLTNINVALNASELSIINNAPDSNFEIAGEKLLNLSIPGENVQNGTYVGPVIVQHTPQYNAIIINGRPSVVYVGAISCIFCAENRWAMILALSRFGSFNSLYKGYSALQDGDVPTLYFNVENISTHGAVTFGNHYSSNSINFFTGEYDSNITQGFQFPQSQMQFFINTAPNQTYKQVMQFMNKTGQFRGTPFTFWGTSTNPGADAVIFGTSNSSAATNLPALSYMTHSDILNQLKSFSTPFSQEEYAAADVYIAEVCPSIHNTASVCSQPSIRTLESKLGLS